MISAQLQKLVLRLPMAHTSSDVESFALVHFLKCFEYISNDGSVVCLHLEIAKGYLPSERSKYSSSDSR